MAASAALLGTSGPAILYGKNDVAHYALSRSTPFSANDQIQIALIGAGDQRRQEQSGEQDRTLTHETYEGERGGLRERRRANVDGAGHAPHVMTRADSNPCYANGTRHHQRNRRARVDSMHADVR